MIAQQIVEAARAYIGTPFHHQARKKGVGIDCVGLLECVGRDVGLPTFGPKNYGRRGNTLEFVEGCLQATGFIKRESLDFEPGDVLVMAMPMRFVHVAIATDTGMVHAWNGAGSTRRKMRGRVVEHHIADRWRRVLVSVWKYPGA